MNGIVVALPNLSLQGHAASAQRILNLVQPIIIAGLIQSFRHLVWKIGTKATHVNCGTRPEKYPTLPIDPTRPWPNLMHITPWKSQALETWQSIIRSILPASGAWTIRYHPIRPDISQVEWTRSGSQSSHFNYDWRRCRTCSENDSDWNDSTGWNNLGIFCCCVSSVLGTLSFDRS